MEKNKLLKTVYFDLGNVLIFFSYPKMIQQVATCTGLKPIEIQRLLFDRNLRETYETGKIDSAELYSIFQKLSPFRFSFVELMEAFSDIFTPNINLWPIVERLKKEGIRLILLSNTSECHYNYIYSHYPILQLFDHKILSYEVGACKPDPLIFQKALALSNCSPNECFYTDDIPEFIAGARKEGLPGEIFTDIPNLKNQLIARGCDFLRESTLRFFPAENEKDNS